jgi:hypothetical protein
MGSSLLGFFSRFESGANNFRRTPETALVVAPAGFTPDDDPEFVHHMPS